MAGGSLLLLIDDIASVLDDVALLTKVAAKKTSGVLGDDLALNAEQVTGVRAERELPVVFAVAKGSLVNKAILVPIALLISYFLPALITPLLMLGGAFLCYEGWEKVWHLISMKWLPGKRKSEERQHQNHLQNLSLSAEDLIQHETEKIKGAIRTDFILSAEIITITLGTVSTSSLTTQIGVLSGISLIMTIGVYGLVAAIVKLDDLGYFLITSANKLKIATGKFILKLAPVLMKGLSIIGTSAMFLVGGGIISHGMPFLHHLAEATLPEIKILQILWPVIFDGLVGLLTGILGVLFLAAGSKITQKIKLFKTA